MSIKLLFLGQLTQAIEFFLPYLSEHGFEVSVINTSDWAFREKVFGTNMPVKNLYENSKIRTILKGPLKWYRKAIFYSMTKTLDLKWDRLSQIKDDIGDIDLIYGNWGSFSLPEIGMVQKFHKPVVYEFLTYPCKGDRFSSKTENFFNKRIVNKLDGRIFPTRVMYNYMRSMFGIPLGQNLIFLECFPKKLFYQKRLPLLSEVDAQPHIVFIGIDDREILPQIEEIASRKIHVHMCNLDQLGWYGHAQESQRVSRKVKNETFIHQFNRFTHDEIADGTFATFLTQFDACLVTYNFWLSSDLARYRNSIPQRFSAALLAGIPIILPEGYLQGCEEIVNEYQIGFAYQDYVDLKNKLCDKALLIHFRENAIKNPNVFSLESNFLKMDKFFKGILE